MSFKAGLLAGRQSGMRKADLASLDDEREPHEMAKGNLTWYLSDGAGGYRHVPELPPAHVLVDGECACPRPAASKADQTAEQFGNQLVYLPVIRSDVNNAALALAELERVHIVHGDDRQHALLLVAHESGLALKCGRIDRIFAALARAALGDELPSGTSFISTPSFLIDAPQPLSNLNPCDCCVPAVRPCRVCIFSTPTRLGLCTCHCERYQSGSGSCCCAVWSPFCWLPSATSCPYISLKKRHINHKPGLTHRSCPREFSRSA